LPSDPAPPDPALATRRLSLRPFQVSDVADLVRLANDREVAASTPLPHPFTDEVARWFLAKAPEDARAGRALHFAVTLREGGWLIGSVTLYLEPRDKRAELFYWIGRQFWGQGYATEAAGAVVRLAFTRLGLERVFASHFADFPASGRVLQKLGMRPEGVDRRHVYKWGVPHDLARYGILREEFEAAQASSNNPP
jgi:ribosomal-protein-alanine N-acetyltransferase